MKGLTIGKVAGQAGIGIETIRFYERQGLIAEPPRTGAGYRLYPEASIGRLNFIKRAKELGFSLNEIKELLLLRQDPRATKADVRARTLAKIEDVRRKIEDLGRILQDLEALVATCDGRGPVCDCPILDAMDEQGKGGTSTAVGPSGPNRAGGEP